MAVMIENFANEQHFHSRLCEELDTEWAAPAAPKPQKRKRSVSFHASVKTWDGLCAVTRNVQRLVWDFWNKSSSTDLLDELMRDRKYYQLCALYDRLGQTVQRMKQLGSGECTALCPGGGGRDISLGRCHLPYIIKLQLLTESARDKCYRMFQHN